MGDEELEQRVAELERRLGYTFQSRGQVETALTHKSYANEQTPQLPHNERMEFLGDAVVSLVVGHLLMARHPEWTEGELSKARAALVSAAGLAEVAESLDLGQALRLGRGEERTGGRCKPSILADSFEAMTAALYLDGGFTVVFDVLRRLFERRLDEALDGIRERDPKTHLQERIQAVYKRAPEYDLVETDGPEHDLRFTVELRVDDVPLSTGVGRTKKEAEQNAAATGLERISAGERLEDILQDSHFVAPHPSHP
jgi:ribonuclease-3